MKKKKSSRHAYFNSIIDDARAGDANSFAVLYAATYEEVYKNCSKAIKGEYDIQDVMFDTYVMAYKKLDEIANAEHFPRWIEIICESQILHYMKKNGHSDRSVRRLMKNKPSGLMISRDNAQQLLESVFLALDQEPNSVDLTTLMAYHEYRSNKMVAQRLLPVIFIVILILIPALIISPTLTVNKDVANSNFHKVVYNMNVKGILPVKTVIATLNGVDQVVSQEGKQDYSVMLRDNGTLKIVATLANNQSKEEIIDVMEIDTEAPNLVSYEKTGDTVILYLSDEGSSGINYDNITVTRLSDMQVDHPLGYDSATGLVVLPFNNEDSVLYLEDNAGNNTSFAMNLR